MMTPLPSAIHRIDPLRAAMKRTFTFSLIALFFVSIFSARAQEFYREPDFSEPLFATETFSIDPQLSERLRDLMIITSQTYGVDMVTRAKALAFALTLQPQDEEVIVQNFRLKHGLNTTATPEIQSDLQTFQVQQQLLPLVDVLSSTEFDAKARIYLSDIAQNVVTPHSSTQEVNLAWSNALPWLKIEDSMETGSGMEVPATPLALESMTMAGLFIQADGTEESKESRSAYVARNMKGIEVTSSVEHGNPKYPTTLTIYGKMVPELESALHEVFKMFSLRSLSIPSGHRITINFGGKAHSPAEGPSAALLCALMLETMVTGEEIDPKFAAIGDLNADGSVQPIYDIDERLRAAASFSNVTHMCLPAKNMAELADILLLKGVNPLIHTQIFSVETYDDAKILALPPDKRPEELNSAMEKFKELQVALARTNANAAISNASVFERLREVVDLAPNHASAKMLLLRASNRHPKTLTIGGSLDYIGNHANSQRDLISNRDIFHPKTSEWVHALINYPDRAAQAYQNLMNDPEAREVLMRQGF